MKNKRYLVLVGLLLAPTGLLQAEPSPRVMASLGAMDEPLSAHLLIAEHTRVTDLLDLVYEPKLPLYVRGRAIAAIGLLDGVNATSTLKVLLHSPLADALRMEALISLLHHPEKPSAPALTVTISEALWSAGDRLYPFLISTLERLSKR